MISDTQSGVGLEVPSSKWRRTCDLPTGVYETSWGGTYWASVTRSGKTYYLGTYSTISSAKAARDAAVERLDGV